jgi:thiol-disulfide isomerase/thioredoxin
VLTLDDQDDPLLQIHFNVIAYIAFCSFLRFVYCKTFFFSIYQISLPSMSCQYASLDVSDVTGMHSINVTQNIRKWKLDGRQQRLEEVAAHPPAPRYLEAKASHEHSDAEQVSLHLTTDDFADFMTSHHMVLVNFYAPWCIWSQRLGPVWEHVSALVDEKPYREMVGMARIDCTNPKAEPICRQQRIQAFPSILVYKGGSNVAFTHYHGDRTPALFFNFITTAWSKVATELGVTEDELSGTLSVDPLAARQLAEQEDLRANSEAAANEGCNISGFIMVKRMPGNFQITAPRQGLSFDPSMLNVTHTVHALSFGRLISPITRQRILKQSTDFLASPLAGRTFSSLAANTTQEHYVKVLCLVYKRLFFCF